MMWRRSGSCVEPSPAVTREVVPEETPHPQQRLEASRDPREAQWALMQNQQDRQVRPTFVSSDKDIIRDCPHPHPAKDVKDINHSCGTEEGDNGAEYAQRGHPQRVFNRQIMKSSLKVRHQVQDALDTAQAAELALREMISSWRAVK